MHAGQRVEADAVLLQHLRRGEHLVERWFRVLGDPAVIVNLARTVDAQADEEPLLLEKPGPVVIEQRAVGLQVVLDPLTGPGMLLLQRDHLLEETESEQRRLAALPREDDFVGGDAVDVVLDEALEDVVRHVTTARPARQHALAEVEAVRAIEVASRTRGLGHDMEASVGTRPEPMRRTVLVQTWGGGRIRCAHEGLRLWPKSARPLVKCSAQCFATVLLPRSRMPPSSLQCDRRRLPEALLVRPRKLAKVPETPLERLGRDEG